MSPLDCRGLQIDLAKFFPQNGAFLESSEVPDNFPEVPQCGTSAEIHGSSTKSAELP
jgi:hypothetical protein